MYKFIGAVGVVLGLAGAAAAQQIGTRTQLNQILSSGYRYTDAFEAFNVASDDNANMNSASLNSGSTIDGQGPGLVNPGVTYSSSTGADLFWDGANYFGSTSKEILSGDTSLVLTYTIPVDAMGVDIREFTGYGSNFSANIYDGASLVGTYSGALDNGGGSQFFGWENAGGITSVVFSTTSSTNYWSPIIDNHTYGNASLTPEPASVAVLALGGLALMRRRRKA